MKTSITESICTTATPTKESVEIANEIIMFIYGRTKQFVKVTIPNYATR